MSFRHWFETRPPAEREQPLTERESAILEKIALKVIEWKMTVPAIIFLESVKPLNYIGAQTMVFFEPFVQTLFNVRDYDMFREMMERRESVEQLLQKIEELDARELVREKAERSRRRASRGKRRWLLLGRRRRDHDPGDSHKDLD